MGASNRTTTVFNCFSQYINIVTASSRIFSLESYAGRRYQPILRMV